MKQQKEGRRKGGKEERRKGGKEGRRKGGKEGRRERRKEQGEGGDARDQIRLEGITKTTQKFGLKV